MDVDVQDMLVIISTKSEHPIYGDETMNWLESQPSFACISYREVADLIPGDRMALFRLIGKANTRSVSGQSRAIFELDPTSSQYFQDSFFGTSILIRHESMNRTLGILP
ncbi:hypothetical protein G6F62_010755 [Rhizopus arrhizus]|nr:hypothetical protein G6F62_010755 [Rhizopus arrhizus]